VFIFNIYSTVLIGQILNWMDDGFDEDVRIVIEEEEIVPPPKRRKNNEKSEENLQLDEAAVIVIFFKVLAKIFASNHRV
jgi:hypothetical protein